METISRRNIPGNLAYNSTLNICQPLLIPFEFPYVYDTNDICQLKVNSIKHQWVTFPI